MDMDPEVVAGILADGRFTIGEPGPQPTLELLAEMRSAPPKEPYDPTPPAGVVREERTLAGVPVRVYRSERSSGAAIVWMHGGGLMMGTYDWDQPFLDGLVAATGCVAISVDYRLAPETPYPGALDDCFAVLEHVCDTTDRVAVGGSSAGAGLAAACALRARDEGLALVHQHLLYPMLDDRQRTASSQWDLLAIWPRELNRFAWQQYLGPLYATDDVPAYAGPARAADLAGVAPAYLHVGGLDGFVEENVAYAGRLMAAGVAVELHVFPRVPHAFDLVAPDAAVTKRATALSDAALARVLS